MKKVLKRLLARLRYWYERIIYEVLMKDLKVIEMRLIKTEKDLVDLGIAPAELLWAYGDPDKEVK